MDKLKQLMFELFDMYDDCDDIKNAIRSLHSDQEISDAEYDTCLAQWEDYLIEYEGGEQNA